MNNPTGLLSLALCAALPLSGCADDQPREDTTLLFGLTEDDVLEIHDHYLPEEDIDVTRARLSAPFNCDLYDDFCEQVGREAAIEITGRHVEQLLAGVDAEDLEIQLDAWVAEAAAVWEPDEDPDRVLRSNTGWATKTKGDVRIRVRNGLTTPLSGDRRAWTQVRLEKKGLLGWSLATATEVCNNPGFTEQVQRLTFSTGLSQETTLEQYDSPKTCYPVLNQVTLNNYLERNNGWFNGATGQTMSYRIYKEKGCGTGLVDGVTLGKCAGELEDWF